MFCWVFCSGVLETFLRKKSEVFEDYNIRFAERPCFFAGDDKAAAASAFMGALEDVDILVAELHSLGGSDLEVSMQ